MREILPVILFVVAAILLFKRFFGSKEEFIECLKFWLMPDIVNWIRGEFWQNEIAKLKIFFWLLSSILVSALLDWLI